MARSSYIYTVQDGHGTIVAAFTVKHELASWLATRAEDFLVSRIADGGSLVGRGDPVQLNPRTLEPAL